MSRALLAAIVLIFTSSTADAAEPATRPAHRFAPTRFDQKVEALRAAGEPVLWTDLKRWPTLAEEDNAVPLLREAAAAVRAGDEQGRAIAEADYPHAFEPPLTKDESAIVGKWVGAIGPVLRLADEIDSRKGFDWGDPPRPPLLATAMTELNEARAVAEALSRDAALALHERDGRRFLRRAGQVARLRDGLSLRPFLIAGLVTIGLDAVRVELIKNGAWDLPVGDGPRDATREDVAAVVAELIDDSGPTRKFEWALRSERVSVIDSLDRVASGMPSTPDETPKPPPTDLMAANMLASAHASGEIAMDYFDGLLVAWFADSPDERAAGQKRVDELFQRLARPRMNERLAALLVPSITRTGKTLDRLITDRHVAAVALAVRLYRLDHDGKPPATLEELVPQYLPRVPEDFEHPDRPPLRYRVADDGGPIVWGVGDNGRDDDGFAGEPHMSAREIRETTDRVTNLKPRPR